MEKNGSTSGNGSPDRASGAAVENQLKLTVETLTRDLESERKRSEKLDSLLIANANLRKKLQEELSDTRNRNDSLMAEVEVMKASISADVAKSAAEASSYKTLYLKALEELTACRGSLQQQSDRATTAEIELDVMRSKLEMQEEQLELVTPSRPQRPTRAMLEHPILEFPLSNLELEQGANRGGSVIDVPDGRLLLDHKPSINDEAEDALLDETALPRVNANELQQVVVGLYRRLKACELVLHETNQARIDALSRQRELQHEIDRLHSRLAVRSPLVVRREISSMAKQQPVSAAQSRTSSATRRPISAPRSTTPSAAGGSRPVSATRTISATRTVATKVPPTTNANTNAYSRPTSGIPSARSASARSNGSATSGADLLRLNAVQLREEYRIRPGARSPVNRGFATGPPAAAGGGASRQPVDGRRMVSPVGRTSDASSLGTAGVAGPTVGARREVVTMKLLLKSGLTDNPPKISRRVNS